MPGAIIDIILVNAFWLSLVFMGYMGILFCRNRFAGPIGRIAKAILSQHAFIVAFVSFLISVGLFAILSIPLYLTQAPVIIPKVIYGILALSAFMYSAYLLILNIFSTKQHDFFILKKQPLYMRGVFLMLVLLIAVDFAISLFVKANAGGDTFYHLARIVAIVSDGFTINSGHYSNLPDAAYHYNVIYVLYATAASLLGAQPVDIYKWSLGFFRLVQWLGIFTLAWYVIGYWLKSKETPLFSSLATIYALCALSGVLFTATYPNKIVNLWLIPFVILVSLFESGKRWAGVALLVVSLMITLTHANAVMAVMFVGLLGILMMAAQKKDILKDKLRLMTYAAVAVVLSFGPVTTALMPSLMTDEQRHLGDFPVINIAGMSMKDPLFDLRSLSSFEFVALLLSIVATLYILRRVWGNLRQRSVVLAVSLFYIVIVYLPPVFTMFNHLLPMWVINRFSAMNILTPILVPIGIYVVAVLTRRFLRGRIKKFPSSIFSGRVSWLLLSCVVVAISLGMIVPGYKKLGVDRQYKRDMFNQLSRAGDDFRGQLKSNRVVLANPDVGYGLASVLNIDALAVHVGHSTSSADTANRVACRDYLLGTLNYESLVAGGVDLIVFSKLGGDIGITKQADSKKYLTRVAENDDYTVYSIKHDSSTMFESEIYAPCRLFKENESR